MSELLAKLMGRTYRAEDPDESGGDEDSTGAEDKSSDADDGAAKAARGDELEPDDDTKDDDDDDDLLGKDSDEAGDTETIEGKAGDGTKEDKQEKAKPTSIPIARFNEAQRKSREREAALTARIDSLTKDGDARVQEEDVAKLEESIAALEVAYNDHLKDGETKEALDVMRQIRKAERDVSTLLSDKKSSAAQAMAVEEIKVDFIIKDLEEKNPILDPKSDEYDDDVVSLISAARTGFESEGMSSSAALDKASREVLRRIQPAAKAADESDGDEEKGLGAKKVDGRKSKQVKANIDAKKAQGADMDVAGVDSDKKGGGVETKSAMDMTDEDMEALPASKLAQLRGDFVPADA